MTEHKSNVEKGLQLEDLVTVVLESLQSSGAITFYRLLNAASYPDFYVLDSKSREWLLECKNLALKKLNATASQPAKTWILSERWVRENILDKEWTLKKYMLNDNVKTRYVPTRGRHKPKREYYSDDSISIREKPIPVLIISHLYVDTNAYQVLKEFFGDNIILTGDQIIAPSPWVGHVFNQLRRLF